MNDYRMTYTSVHAEEPQTCIVTERNEAAARKFFNAAHKGMGHTLTGAELLRENTCATKDQEREAVEKIRALIAELGPQSYVRTALDGCLEIAECNIENDFGDSWKARAEHYDAEMTEAQQTVVQLRERIKSMEEFRDVTLNKVKNLEAELEAARRRFVPTWLYKSIWTMLSEDLSDTRERMRELADQMAEHAERPESEAFRNAVQFYRVRKEHAEVLEQTIAGLEDIEPPRVWNGDSEAGE